MHQLRTSDQGDRMSDTTTEILPSRWDANASFWVQIIREHRDKYRNELTDRAMLKAIGEPAGLAVLDAGCGEGYLSRILASNGATVTGVDSSASSSRQRERRIPPMRFPSPSMSVVSTSCHTK